jgi:multicomponent K+:H+ antiporter subunit D
MLPIIALLSLCIWLSIVPGPVLEFMESAAALVSVPEYYVLEVMGTGSLASSLGGEVQ